MAIIFQEQNHLQDQLRFKGLVNNTALWPRRQLNSSDKWMDDLRFDVLFNSISVISGRLVDGNERLCVLKPRLRLRRFRLERGSNSESLDQ